MGDRLAGKTILVTAAGQGIGRSSALAFALEGAQVIASDVNRAAVEALAAGQDRIRALALDVRDQAAIDALAGEVEAVDVLFNVAGYVHHGSILEVDATAWQVSLDLNVGGMYRMIRACLPAMLARGGGGVINMASVASSITGAPRRCAYGTSKAAVIGLTKSVAADFVGRGVRCNAICPGTVETPSLDERIEAMPDPHAARQAFIARQPMGRLGRPEEIAQLAVYLASDEAAYVTGQIFPIDGGWTI